MTQPGQDEEERLGARKWLERVRKLERRGEFLLAYDVARKGLNQYPNDVLLQYRSVLVLARAGARSLAERRYSEYGLSNWQNEDIAALGARLSKDAALCQVGELRASKAAIAAAQYEAILDSSGGHYPGINAATLFLLAGDTGRACQLASQVLDTLDVLGAGKGDERYYRLASRAEALLILGRGREAVPVLAEAFSALNRDWAALATTRRQLRLVCNITGQDDSLLGSFLPPAVIHYCGHMIAREGEIGRFSNDEESAVALAVKGHLSGLQNVIAYGSLAAGADILIAEALIACGGELHVALPFCLEEFIEVSVRPSGEGWVERFHQCLSSAQSVRFATEDGYLGDDQLFTYCSGLAMGLAVLRAHYLDGPASQLAVWDGEPALNPVGTAFDVVCWKDLGLSQSHIPVSSKFAHKFQEEAATPDLVRVQCAMLFGDVKGFSKLGDKQLPNFVEQVLGRLAVVIDSFGDKVSFRNTWGDGIFVVFNELVDAARCALAMQEVMGELGNSDYGLPQDLALRLGGHYGPIYRKRDPILKVDNYFGAHVSRTARIEPVTPEGAVYVTEPFAAMLALEKDSEFACDYVGRIPAAKGYGDLSMYLLHRPA